PLLKSTCKMTESCILEFFENFGINISSAYISSQWTKGYNDFHQEKSDIYAAGLSNNASQQIDDTSARVMGDNHYTQIVCNDFYSAYFTTKRKDRLTVLDVFRNFKPRQFLYNEQAIKLMKDLNVSRKVRREISRKLLDGVEYNEVTFDSLLAIIKLGPQQRTRIKEACAVVAYWNQTNIPVINVLMCDDAPQFKLLTKELTLCWVHDGRHYKKLNPIIPKHKKILDNFLTRYWAFYHKLKKYKKSPTLNKATSLSSKFDKLFSTLTSYEQLNKRISKTLAKKKELILVLKYPWLPLHNNASELAARVQARARDISFHTVSTEGTKIKDTFMTISQTAKKLKVRTYDYIFDRVSAKYELPSLAEIIREKCAEANMAHQTIPLNL
ncbi:MAG: transposase, partial [Methylococcales bacterium]|nr:transposase [Methylococcales bacterium]